MTMTEQIELSQTTVGDAMHPGVLTCPLETPLRDVARMMARFRIHAVVVFTEGADDDGPLGLWGVVSDTDLVRAAAEADFEGRTAGGTARTPVVMVSPHESLARAAELMAQNRVTHLVVVAWETERPIGILSTLDVARALAVGP